MANTALGGTADAGDLHVRFVEVGVYPTESATPQLFHKKRTVSWNIIP